MGGFQLCASNADCAAGDTCAPLGFGGMGGMGGGMMICRAPRPDGGFRMRRDGGIPPRMDGGGTVGDAGGASDGATE
jgi:hypothetical protein